MTSVGNNENVSANNLRQQSRPLNSLNVAFGNIPPRKRRANLTRINLSPTVNDESQIAQAELSDDGTSSSSRTNNPCEKRLRLISVSSTATNFFASSRGSSRSSSSSPSPSPSICSADEFSDVESCQPTPSVKVQPLVRGGTVIGNGEYELIGDGDECKAVHIVSGDIFHCQALEQKGYNHFLKVVERIEMCKNMWLSAEFRELKRLIVPEGTHFVLSDDGRLYYLLSPDHFGSLSTQWRSEGCSATVRRATSPWSENQSRSIFRQVVTLVKYCHRMGIYLRDFRLQNIVYTNREKNMIRLLNVRNVHVAAEIGNDDVEHVHCCPVYAAPEVLKVGKTYSAKPADVWGLGILLFMLLTGRYPFYGSNPPEMARRIRSCKYSFCQTDNVTPSARLLAHSLIRLNLWERPLIDDILASDWIKGVSKLSNSNEFPSAPLEYLEFGHTMVDDDASEDHVVPSGIYVS